MGLFSGCGVERMHTVRGGGAQGASGRPAETLDAILSLIRRSHLPRRIELELGSTRLGMVASRGMLLEAVEITVADHEDGREPAPAEGTDWRRRSSDQKGLLADIGGLLARLLPEEWHRQRVEPLDEPPAPDAPAIEPEAIREAVLEQCVSERLQRFFADALPHAQGLWLALPDGSVARSSGAVDEGSGDGIGADLDKATERWRERLSLASRERLLVMFGAERPERHFHFVAGDGSGLVVGRMKAAKGGAILTAWQAAETAAGDG